MMSSILLSMESGRLTSVGKDALDEATEILEEPSRGVKRKVLASLNLIVAITVALHVSIQLITVGHLPVPARDAVVLPLIGLVNLFSAIYNIRALRGEMRARPSLDVLSRWISVFIIQLTCLAIVHFSPNTATSLLLDHSLSVITIFLTGVILGRWAALGWCIVTLLSLGIAVNNRGADFEYTLMTQAEILALQAEGVAVVQARTAAAAAEQLAPVSVAVFATVSIVFTALTFAATYFESGLLGRVTAAIPVALKKIQIAAREKQRLAQENMRMSLELDVAQRIQAMVLPRGDELRVDPNLEVSARMFAASEIGGDIYDVLPGPDGAVCFVIGDVTDHGLASGVVMLMAQAALRCALEETNGDLVRSLHRVNSVIYKNVQARMGDGRNMTLALLRYHNGDVWVAGQHESVLLIRSDGSVEDIDTLPLGINIGLLPEVDDMIDQHQFTLEKGDLMVLYTDGVTEAENRKGVQFGVERMRDAILKRRRESCEDIMRGTLADVDRWIDGGTIHDDMTLVLVRRAS